MDSMNLTPCPLLDLRRIAPARRRSLLRRHFQALRPGETFICVDDENLAPPRARDLLWEFIERGPEIWLVRVGRRGRLFRHSRPGTSSAAARHWAVQA